MVLLCGGVKSMREGVVGAEVYRQYPTLMFSESLTKGSGWRLHSQTKSRDALLAELVQARDS